MGRPNVGKSTLFNRLTKTRRAIVNEEAGTTRDRQYGKCEWDGREFSVIDTGGWVVNSADVFETRLNGMVLAIEEADIILLWWISEWNYRLRPWSSTDSADTPNRYYWFQTKPILSTGSTMLQSFTSWAGEPIVISAINGLGTGDFSW